MNVTNSMKCPSLFIDIGLKKCLGLGILKRQRAKTDVHRLKEMYEDFRNQIKKLSSKKHNPLIHHWMSKTSMKIKNH